MHRLRRTPATVMATETSLTLEGKAYKWWMSLPTDICPKTWEEFEAAFRKEFLPQNEKDQNWTAWDKCKMEGLTLNQYVSKYQEVILKLDGLDDFQKVRGFVRGLDTKYQAKVKTKYPKTLEAAIQSALIFDDTMDKRGMHKSTKFNSSQSNAHKRKFATNSAETQRSLRGLVVRCLRRSMNEAKKEKLCYHCLGSDHEKKNCPQLPRKNKDKNKEKAAHMVQKLPLDASPKYSAVEVSHTAEMHECCLTASMWQETFGPHDLVRMHGSIYGHRVRILIDDGATHNFLNYKLVKKLKLPETKSSHRYVVSTVMGDDHDVWDTQVQQVPVFVQEHTMVLDFQVMNMSCADVILGREWLHGLGLSAQVEL